MKAIFLHWGLHHGLGSNKCTDWSWSHLLMSNAFGSVGPISVQKVSTLYSLSVYSSWNSGKHARNTRCRCMEMVSSRTLLSVMLRLTHGPARLFYIEVLSDSSSFLWASLMACLCTGCHYDVHWTAVVQTSVGFRFDMLCNQCMELWQVTLTTK